MRLYFRNSNMSMSQIFDILHKMDINWSVIREYLNKEDQMLSDNSRYVMTDESIANCCEEF